MKGASVAVLLLLLGGAVAGCGSQGRSSSTAAQVAPSTTRTSAARATPTTERPPHFATREAAMTYLASAWNRRDLVSLKHVTNPAARDQLDQMHAEATNLRLDHCDRRPQGDYVCHFRHDYPAGYVVPAGAPGEAVFVVGPAETPGWYMTVFESCG